MKVKMLVIFFTMLLFAGSLSFAGDQKPFKGWVEPIGDPNYVVNPLDYPYLAEIIGERGTPLWADIQLYQGINNIGGTSIHENVQMFYLGSEPDTFEFYEDSTITVANGDQIFVEIEAVYYISTGEFTATENVVGGTGRFEGVEGLLEISQGFKAGKPILIYDGGYIMTVGKAKKQ